LKVDAETGEAVNDDDVIKAYEISKGKYIEITDEELEAVALKSRHTIEIDEFVPKKEIDDLYHLRPYYIAPDGDVGKDAFVVIRDVIARMDRVALGRVVLTSREHVIALEPRDMGLVGMLLRYPYELVDAKEIFADVPDIKIPNDMLVSVRRVLESYESSVIQGWWPDSRRGHRCGRARTAPVTTAASCDIRAI
jgi:DNA end-binding protein Ku